MQSLITSLEKSYTKDHVVDVRSGDVVRVHQRITEGNKSRIQIFEGLVIRTKRKKSATSTISVRRIASGVGVEKTFLLHSPLIEKVEVIKRSKVRRNYLSYMRERSGKSARLDAVDFDKTAVNAIPDPEVKPEPKAEEEITNSESTDEAQADTAQESDKDESPEKTA